MKTAEIQTLLDQGVSTLARRPRRDDRELELIAVSKLERGYVIGSTPGSSRTRWAVSAVERVEAARSKITARHAIDAAEARARQTVRRIQSKLIERLVEREIPESTGPDGARVVTVKLPLHVLRKLEVLVDGL